MNRSEHRQRVNVATIFTAVYFPNEYYDRNKGKSPLPIPLYSLWVDRGNATYRPMQNMLGKGHNEKLATTTVE